MKNKKMKLIKNFPISVILLISLLTSLHACKAQHSILKEKIKVIYFNADDPKETTKLDNFLKKIPFYRYKNKKEGKVVFFVGHTAHIYDEHKNKKIYIPKDSLENYEILKYYEYA